MFWSPGKKSGENVRNTEKIRELLKREKVETLTSLCRMKATLKQDLRKVQSIEAADMVTNRNSPQDRNRYQVDFCTKRFLNPRVTMIFLDLYRIRLLIRS